MISRKNYLEQLIAYKDKDLIKVITGVRRCGKSVLLFDIYKNWLVDNGIPESNIVTVNLENITNISLRNAKSLYEHIHQQTNNIEHPYIMIDEIQYIEGFEDLLNTLKNEGNDVYVTGSNSYLLSSDIKTSLRGRSIEIKVYPLSFKEYFDYFKGDKHEAFNTYLLYGGFPYAAQEEHANLKQDYLKMLEDTIATKDVIERHSVRNKEAFLATYQFLCSNIGSSISINKITNTLKSNGYSTITNDTISNYVYWLCDAFLFYKAQRFDLKGRKYLKTQFKMYAVDLGLRNVQLNFRQTEITHLLENLVYLELIKRGYIVDIGKNSNKEIDFVARMKGEVYYIQVAHTIQDEEKRKSELASFKGLDDGFKKILITNDNDPFTNLGNGYKKINTLNFLLNEDCFSTIG